MSTVDDFLSYVAHAREFPPFASGANPGPGLAVCDERPSKLPATIAHQGRPTVQVLPGETPRIIDEAESALVRADLGLYQRGSFIVRPAMLPIAVADGRHIEVQRLLHVTKHHIAESMSRAADFQRFNSRTEQWISTDCPLRYAETYLARVGQWKLPVLTGIINAPTLRADGSILAMPGYDGATGLLFDPQNTPFPHIPVSPSRDDALAALSFLYGAIDTFPFVAPADRAVAVSAILTAVFRRQLSNAPLHGFSAPTAGSGKSMLVDIASVIATGHEASVMAQGKNEEEMEKRIGAALIAGDALISIDNCEYQLGGDLLCQALTQKSLKVRVLGKSINAEVLNNAAIYATGNNLALAGDMCRRAVFCSLDAGVERPELRCFDKDPLATAKAKRGELVVAALTVLRAYFVAGRPQQVPQLGSFAEWSDTVRSALIWLGEADPCLTMEAMRQADPKLEALSAVMAQWHALIGERRVTVKEVIDVATASRPEIRWSENQYANPEFREALLAVAGGNGSINGRRLGKWLSYNQKRLVAGMKFSPDGVSSGIQKWKLVVQQQSNIAA